MIPKNIIVCWFGDKSNMRKDVEIYCLDRMKKIFSDHNFIFVDESVFDIHKFSNVEELYNSKKYAYVADVARLWALYTYGGIYLDTDMLCIKNFDETFYSKNFIIGARQYSNDVNNSDIISAGLIASSKENKDILKLLNECIEKSSLKFAPIMNVANSMIRSKGFTKQKMNNLSNIVTIDDITIYPADYFSCTFFNSDIINITKNTYCIHLYAASWLSKKRKEQQLIRIKNIIEHLKL